MEQINISGITVDVVRKNIKNMHLAVYPPAGRVRLAVPLRMNAEAVRLFAVSKLGWIRRHQRNFADQERLGPREYKERESHYFQGRRYLLRIKETSGAGYVALQSKTYLDLHVKPDAGLEYRRNVIKEWHRRELKKNVAELAEYWTKKMNVQVTFFGVKQMKTKWGSCNITQKRIWLNLELAKKPLPCLEYVLVHELAHLLERHHNERFHALVSQYLPGWKQLRDELNKLPVSHADWVY
ncbi:MAG: M48 family peptidase [Candidatus Electrothrix sp. AUS1_2]|nr:M48 family peptidase [Candidatus Electrothrix sp. AUS1_2]